MAENNEKVSSTIGKSIATIAVWGGSCALSYLFHSFGILSGDGAFGIVFAAFLLTVGIWSLK